MPTTTNFGWTTPADTDLVKDGASAIRTLGNGIDTSLMDLKGGTTGQVLSKASNTDMDFVWTADASGIPATIIDAKGDLIAGTAADTAARLAVGTNNQALLADSSTSTGLKWAASPQSLMTSTGDVLYASSANNPARLGIGSTGQVLTVSGGVPVWSAAPVSTPSYALLNSGNTSLSGVATKTISSISGYNDLHIMIDFASSGSASSVIQIRFNSDTATNYGYQGLGLSNQSTYGSSVFQALSSMANTLLPMGKMGNSTTDVFGGGIHIFGCNSTGVKTGWVTGYGNGTTAEYSSYTFRYTGTSVISSVSIISSVGNFDDGFVYVYGA